MRIHSALANATAIAALSISTSVFARADIIPPATLLADVSGGPTINVAGTTKGSQCFTVSGGGCGVSSASISYSPGSITGFAEGTTTGGGDVPYTTAGNDGTFYLEVLGPSGFAVPLLITASGSASASGPGANAVVEVNASSVTFKACAVSGGPDVFCGSTPSFFSGTQAYSVPSDTISTVEVSDGGFSEYGNGSFSATSDPMITIDPTFADANLFTLEFSAAPGGTGGGGGPSPVPEPSTLALLGTGLFVLSGTVRRRLRSTGE